VANKWLTALREEESKHNTTAALRERWVTIALPGGEKPQTPKVVTDKTDKIASRYKNESEKPEIPKNPTDKTDKNNLEAEQLGLVATWSIEFGYISIHDPLTGEWWDLQTKEAPDWAVREARKRRELYKDGNRRAYRLTSQEMEDIWKAEREPEGIVEEHPIGGEQGAD
jgi:hypothetical protein